jgi:hypothetical protein
MFDAAWRRSPAPGTPIRPPHRRGRPSLRERPERVAFAPAVPVALRLDPDPERRTWYGGWRRKIELPACRLVWVGDAIPAPGKWPGWHVEILVTPLTSRPDAPELQTLSVPISVLGLLAVGRVLADPSQERPSHGFGGPSPQLRFLGSEWIIELCFGSPQTSIVSAAALGLKVWPLPAHFADSPLCVTSDPSTGKQVLIPCWELFRFYYAQMPAVARLVLEFPRWTEETLERLLSFFDGHRFQNSVARPSVPSSGAATRLHAIGRDAAVSFARRGRLQIRAVPPFAGPITLEVVGHPTMVGEHEALFVQQILESRALPAGQPGIRWWSEPVEPAFGSHVEHLAWWVMYFAGKLPRAIEPPLASWETFVELAERAPGLVRIRHIEDPDALRVAFLHALARKRAFVPKLTARGRTRPHTPARAES